MVFYARHTRASQAARGTILKCERREVIEIAARPPPTLCRIPNARRADSRSPPTAVPEPRGRSASLADTTLAAARARGRQRDATRRTCSSARVPDPAASRLSRTWRRRKEPCTCSRRESRRPRVPVCSRRRRRLTSRAARVRKRDYSTDGTGAKQRGRCRSARAEHAGRQALSTSAHALEQRRPRRRQGHAQGIDIRRLLLSATRTSAPAQRRARSPPRPTGHREGRRARAATDRRLGATPQIGSVRLSQTERPALRSFEVLATRNHSGAFVF